MTDNLQTALVTGASSGIGRDTAIKLAAEGFEVIAAARRLERLNELAQERQSIRPMQVDLSDPKDTERFCHQIVGLAEPIDVLVNNAGYALRGAVEGVSLEAVRRNFEVNYFALLQVTRACLPGMRQQGRGTIVNVSSVVGKLPFPLSGIYASTKFAVEGISDAMRLELRPFGIRVITVRPGVIGSEFNQAAALMSGDMAAQAPKGYRPVFEAVGAAMGRLFSQVQVPGPELIADIIVQAILSDEPKASYAAGPFSDDILAQRLALDDDAFFAYWAEKTGLADVKI